jgi:hypothetical protein
MTSFRQIDANRRNARNGTGLITEEGKQRSRCNAIRIGPRRYRLFTMPRAMNGVGASFNLVGCIADDQVERLI